MIKLSEIAGIIGAKVIGVPGNGIAGEMFIDSRKIYKAQNGIFVALPGSVKDGHKYISDCFQKGLRHFIVNQLPEDIFIGACFFIVEDSVDAMQKLAAEKLKRSNLKHCLVVTGSNGKTIVKEWLSNLLQSKFSIVKTPKSYNSQIGVPLSVWQVADNHDLAIFEAGISKVGEMEKLADIVKADIGIFTHLGDAHSVGFASVQEKIHEKIKIFASCGTIVIDIAEIEVIDALVETYADKKLVIWKSKILYNDKKGSTELSVSFDDNKLKLVVPFNDKANIQNAINCAVTMSLLGFENDEIATKIGQLESLKLRLEQIKGVYNSTIINDTYNADMSSFKNALEFIENRNFTQKKVLVISEFEEVYKFKPDFIKKVARLISDVHFDIVIAIGDDLVEMKSYLKDVEFYNFSDVNQLIAELDPNLIYDKLILVKGARKYQLDLFVDHIAASKHSVNLETNLEAVSQNVSYYGAKVGSDTKIMGVIKAAGYGSGAEVIGKFLEYKKVDYLAVANIDEGIALRKAGVSIPLIILNPENGDFIHLTKYQLEPEVYDLSQLKNLVLISNNHLEYKLKIHLKLDTGMHRLGFLKDELDEVISWLLKAENLVVSTIFTHLSSSDNPDFDEFTLGQLAEYEAGYNKIVDAIGYKPLRHALNTSGIERFPQFSFDIVRLGLGLYGINEALVKRDDLMLAHTLSASIIQIKKLKKGDFVGYNKSGKMEWDGVIAMVNIGYADGLMRASGNGNYSFIVKGKKAPIIGNVCMDITMIDITGIENVQLGDRVVVFGAEGGIFKLSKVNNTIPYEIISRISERVNRTYVE